MEPSPSVEPPSNTDAPSSSAGTPVLFREATFQAVADLDDHTLTTLVASRRTRHIQLTIGFHSMTMAAIPALLLVRPGSQDLAFISLAVFYVAAALTTAVLRRGHSRTFSKECVDAGLSAETATALTADLHRTLTVIELPPRVEQLVGAIRARSRYAEAARSTAR